MDKVKYIEIQEYDDGTEIGAKVSAALEAGAESVILVEDGKFTTRVHKDGRLSTANGEQAFRAADPDAP